MSEPELNEREERLLDALLAAALRDPEPDEVPVDLERIGAGSRFDSDCFLGRFALPLPVLELIAADICTAVGYLFQYAAQKLSDFRRCAVHARRPRGRADIGLRHRWSWLRRAP